MSTEQGGKDLRARRAARQKRGLVPVEGLRIYRVAAGLTQRELAEVVDSNQTTIADLERGNKADLNMLGQLCQALTAAPEDLTSASNVQGAPLWDGRGSQAEETFEEERTARRQQVNRIARELWRLGIGSSSIKLGGLKARRLEAGLSQRELARLVGTNQTTISELEKKYASRGAYMNTIKKLCRALGVSPADLICKEPVE